MNRKIEVTGDALFSRLGDLGKPLLPLKPYLKGYLDEENECLVLNTSSPRFVMLSSAEVDDIKKRRDKP